MIGSTVDLEAVNVYCTRAISLRDDLGADPQVFARLPMDMDCLVLSLRDYIWSEKRDDIRIEYPKDWIEALKERWAPQWLLAKFPVKMKRHDIKVYDGYPSLKRKTMGMPVRLLLKHYNDGEGYAE
jgi:hypothetical protein